VAQRTLQGDGDIIIIMLGLDFDWCVHITHQPIIIVVVVAVILVEEVAMVVRVSRYSQKKMSPYMI
jgi:hypothetical protein